MMRVHSMIASTSRMQTDLLFAGSAALSAVMSIQRANVPFWVRLGVVLLHLGAAIAFALRSRVHRRPTLKHATWALPSMLLAGWVVSRPDTVWPMLYQLAFFAGSVWTVFALASLGSSFAVFPVRRPIVTRGLYRLIRHPMYLGELVLCLVASACVTHTWSLSLWVSVSGFVILIVAFAWRVCAEEAELQCDSRYQTYVRRVRYRWIPFVW